MYKLGGEILCWEWGPEMSEKRSLNGSYGECESKVIRETYEVSGH